jgi:hypothetical protein
MLMAQQQMNSILLLQLQQSMQSPGKTPAHPALPVTPPPQPPKIKVHVSKEELQQMSLPPLSPSNVFSFTEHLRQKGVNLEFEQLEALMSENLGASALAGEDITLKYLEAKVHVSRGDAVQIKKKAKIYARKRKLECQGLGGDGKHAQKRTPTRKSISYRCAPVRLICDKARPENLLDTSTQWYVCFPGGGEWTVWGPPPEKGEQKRSDEQMFWKGDDGEWQAIPAGETAPAMDLGNTLGN